MWLCEFVLGRVRYIPDIWNISGGAWPDEVHVWCPTTFGDLGTFWAGPLQVLAGHFSRSFSASGALHPRQSVGSGCSILYRLTRRCLTFEKFKLP